jgi:hypothetical protein
MALKKTTRTTTVEIEITEASLTSEEERVLRLRHGFAAPEDLVLELKPTQNEDALRALLAKEHEMVQKLATQEEKRAERKKKIVSSLRAKPKS